MGSGRPARKAASRKAPPKRAQRGCIAGKSELRQLSKTELYQRVTDQGIAGRSKMSREELIDALARAGRRRKKSAA
jgi:DNA end-binding protein Ku